MIQIKLFERAVSGCNYTSYRGRNDLLVYQILGDFPDDHPIRKKINSDRKTGATELTVEDQVNIFLTTIAPEDLVRVEFRPLKVFSGYPAPNKYVYVESATVYYMVGIKPEA